MNTVTAILQKELSAAENRMAAAEGMLKEAQKSFRQCKSELARAAIKVQEIQHALLLLGEKPDVKNA